MMNAASLSGGSAISAAAEELKQRMLSKVVTILKGLNFRMDLIMTNHLINNMQKISYAIKKPAFKMHCDGA